MMSIVVCLKDAWIVDTCLFTSTKRICSPEDEKKATTLIRVTLPTLIRSAYQMTGSLSISSSSSGFYVANIGAGGRIEHQDGTRNFLPRESPSKGVLQCCRKATFEAFRYV